MLYGGSVATKSTDASSRVGRSRERVADAQLQTRRVEAARAAGSAVPSSAMLRSRPSCSAASDGDDVVVDRRPARIELDAERPPRPARDRRAEQRPADAGERVEHELAGLG